jgi:hypothetical protein
MQATASLQETTDLTLLGTNHPVVEVLQQKSKANEGTPIAYNLFYVNTMLKSIHNQLQIENYDSQISKLTPILE